MSAKFETYKDNAGKLRWRLKAGNGQVIATASQGYASKASLDRSIEIVKQGSANVEMYEDAKSEHRWRMKATNGNIICSSGEGYVQRSSCKKGLESVQRNAPGTIVIEAS